MVLLRGLNYDYSGQQKTKIKNDVVSGATTLSLENTNGFADDDFIIIAPGTENAEIIRVDDTVSKKESITCTALKFNHSAGTTVYRSAYDKMRFYESTTTGDSGTWNVVDTIDMDFSETHTALSDPDATPNLYYRRTFYNSVTFVESSIYLSKSWQTDEEELYVTPEEMRVYLQFDENDFPSPVDLRFFVKIAQTNVDLDLDTSNNNILFIATLLMSKVEVMKALAARALSKGYVQINAEGRIITKAYQELRLEAENATQEYKAFIIRNNRREATGTNFMSDTTLVDDYTRTDIINIMNGTTNAVDFQNYYGLKRY